MSGNKYLTLCLIVLALVIVGKGLLTQSQFDIMVGGILLLTAAFLVAGSPHGEQPESQQQQPIAEDKAAQDEELKGKLVDEIGLWLEMTEKYRDLAERQHKRLTVLRTALAEIENVVNSSAGETVAKGEILAIFAPISTPPKNGLEKAEQA